jgi:hypothetical protein
MAIIESHLYKIEISGEQALILQRALEVVRPIDLASMPALITIRADILVEEAARLGRMLDLLEPTLVNSFVS